MSPHHLPTLSGGEAGKAGQLSLCGRPGTCGGGGETVTGLPSQQNAGLTEKFSSKIAERIRF